MARFEKMNSGVKKERMGLNWSAYANNDQIRLKIEGIVKDELAFSSSFKDSQEIIAHFEKLFQNKGYHEDISVSVVEPVDSAGTRNILIEARSPLNGEIIRVGNRR